MNNKTLMEHLRCIPDFPKKGINFRDVTTLYKDAECMKIMLDEMYEALQRQRYHQDCRGGITRFRHGCRIRFAKIGAGVVLARKPGKVCPLLSLKSHSPRSMEWTS